MDEKDTVRVEIIGWVNSGKSIILTIIENALKEANIECDVVSPIELLERPKDPTKHCQKVLEQGHFQDRVKVDLITTTIQKLPIERGEHYETE